MELHRHGYKPTVISSDFIMGWCLVFGCVLFSWLWGKWTFYEAQCVSIKESLCKASDSHFGVGGDGVFGNMWLPNADQTRLRKVTLAMGKWASVWNSVHVSGSINLTVAEHSSGRREARSTPGLERSLWIWNSTGFLKADRRGLTTKNNCQLQGIPCP